MRPLRPDPAALVGGSASAGALLELRPHIRNCATCRATVRELHATRLGRLAAVWPFPALLAPCAGSRRDWRQCGARIGRPSATTRRALAGRSAHAAGCARASSSGRSSARATASRASSSTRSPATRAHSIPRRWRACAPARPPPRSPDASRIGGGTTSASRRASIRSAGWRSSWRRPRPTQPSRSRSADACGCPGRDGDADTGGRGDHSDGRSTDALAAADSSVRPHGRRRSRRPRRRRRRSTSRWSPPRLDRADRRLPRAPPQPAPASRTGGVRRAMTQARRRRQSMRSRPTARRCALAGALAAIRDGARPLRPRSRASTRSRTARPIRRTSARARSTSSPPAG